MLLRITIVAIALLGLGLGAKAWHDTTSDPIVHRTTVELADFAPDADPITVALISDIHVVGPDMPPSRLTEIVAQINALQPDAVLIAGDLVSDRRTATHIYQPDEVVAPLAALEAPRGTIVVPGNHDHWYNMPALAAEMKKAGLTLLSNEAISLGPLVIGGLDDEYTGMDDLPATLEDMSRLDGASVVLSHSPDAFPDLPANFGLMLAGHTHCGQVRYPWGGSPATMSKFGQRYACGCVDENGNTVITGAGLGTSLIPLRLFSRGEIWLIEIRPPKQDAPAAEISAN